MVSDPDVVKQVFKGDPEVFRAGEGNAILSPLVGHNSVLTLDGSAHMTQRKLMLPPFHGRRMQAYGELMRDIAQREVDSWPAGGSMTLWPRMQAITLEIILQAVFGLDEGPRLDALRSRLRDVLAASTAPITMLLIAMLGASRFERLKRGPARARPGRPAPVRADPRAPRGPRPGEPQRHPLDAAERPLRGRRADVRRRAARRAGDAAGGRPRDHRHVAGLDHGAPGAPPRRARAPARRGGRGRGRVHGRRGQGDAAAAPGAARRGAPPLAGHRGRRAAAARRRRRRALHPPGAPASRRLPRAVALPPRALPRAAGRDLHLDPVRRRRAALPGRQLRAVRDEAGADRDDVAHRARCHLRHVRARDPARDHHEPRRAAARSPWPRERRRHPPHAGREEGRDPRRPPALGHDRVRRAGHGARLDRRRGPSCGLHEGRLLRELRQQGGSVPGAPGRALRRAAGAPGPGRQRRRRTWSTRRGRARPAS